MAIIKSIELINRFIDEVAKEKYPKLTRKQIIDICYSPFRYLRIAIARPNMPTIRFKNLGKFEPNTFYILKYLRNLDNAYLNNYIPRDRYEHLKIVFIDHVNRRIKEIEDEYKHNIESGLTYKVDGYEYNRLLNHYKNHLRYANLVEVKEDDLKSYSDKYKSLYNRQPTV